MVVMLFGFSNIGRFLSIFFIILQKNMAKVVKWKKESFNVAKIHIALYIDRRCVCV